MAVIASGKYPGLRPAVNSPVGFMVPALTSLIAHTRSTSSVGDPSAKNAVAVRIIDSSRSTTTICGVMTISPRAGGPVSLRSRIITDAVTVFVIVDSACSWTTGTGSGPEHPIISVSAANTAISVVAAIPDFDCGMSLSTLL